MRGRVSTPGWLRHTYRAMRSLSPAAVSSPIPPELIEGCRCCATRYHLLHHMPKRGVVAELGTLRGDFARHIVERADPRELHLVDIDFSQFDDRGLKSDIVKLHHGLTHKVMSAFPDAYFDWVYVDADHAYEATLLDARTSAPKIRPGGFLVFNDFAHIDRELGRYGVHRAVSDFVREERWPVTLFAFNPSALYDIALQRPG